jgi:hypothetical protein
MRGPREKEARRPTFRQLRGGPLRGEARRGSRQARADEARVQDALRSAPPLLLLLLLLIILASALHLRRSNSRLSTCIRPLCVAPRPGCCRAMRARQARAVLSRLGSGTPSAPSQPPLRALATSSPSLAPQPRSSWTTAPRHASPGAGGTSAAPNEDPSASLGRHFYLNKVLEAYAARPATRMTLRQLVFFGRRLGGDREKILRVGVEAVERERGRPRSAGADVPIAPDTVGQLRAPRAARAPGTSHP